MNIYNIWYVHRLLICQIYIKGIWLQIKFVEIFWGEEKIDALKRGGYASKTETVILFSCCQKVKATSCYYK